MKKKSCKNEIKENNFDYITQMLLTKNIFI